MRHTKSSLFLSIPLLTLPCLADIFPNGDFENAGTSWEEVSGTGTFSFSYPTTGGNDGGFGIIDHSAADAGFGIWVGNDGQPFTVASLGLEAGSTYDFTQDMRILDGPNIGGFKLDFTNGGENAGSTGDLRPSLIGNGSTWETYSFRITIPTGVDGFKVVPLWGVDSSVGFDNISFDPTPILPPVDPPVVELSKEPQFATGTLVSWVPTNPEKVHQPQSSQDGTTWTDLGPAFLGTETTTILDPGPMPGRTYRVQEKDPAGPQSLFNGDFEIADFENPNCPESWICIDGPGQTVARTEDDSFSGVASVRLAVQNGPASSPNTVVFQQNLGSVGGFVTPGESYTFSFRAKQIENSTTYSQGYKIVWFDAGNAPTGTEVGPTGFTGGDSTWAEISASNLVAPAGAASVLVEFFANTGAVPSVDEKGEVLLDDIRLAVGSATQPTDLATTTVPGGVGVTLLTKSGVTYKAQQSENLFTFDDLTGTFTGNGQMFGAGIPDGGPSHFFRILEIPEDGN